MEKQQNKIYHIQTKYGPFLSALPIIYTIQCIKETGELPPAENKKQIAKKQLQENQKQVSNLKKNIKRVKLNWHSRVAY